MIPFVDNLISWARTILMVAGAATLAWGVGELHGHSRGVADDKAEAQVQYDKVSQENSALALQEQGAEQRIHDLTTFAKTEVPHVDTYIPGPGLAPVALPDPGYTNTFVCLWNLPLHGDAGGSGSAAAAACAQSPGAQDLSAVTRDDVLNNELDNMGKCVNAYLRVDALQRELANGGAKHDDHPPQ